ncbi:mast cell protease 9 [Aphomia sociella]
MDRVIISRVDINNTILIPRVINGWPAKLGDVPYQVALKYLKSRIRQLYVTFCGATIIAPTKLISAAHCFHQKSSKCAVFQESIVIETSKLHRQYAVAGNLLNKDVYKSTDAIGSGQWRRLKKVIYPSRYKFPKDDIAVVEPLCAVQRAAAACSVPNKHLEVQGPIPYSSINVDYKGTCLVSGYGRISMKKRILSEILLLAHLELIPKNLCSRIHKRNMRKLICTSTKVSDVAKGDSGGPLVCSKTGDPKESNRGILVGVVSGHRPRAGSFFTRVSSYYKYIEKNNKQITTGVNRQD